MDAGGSLGYVGGGVAVGWEGVGYAAGVGVSVTSGCSSFGC